MASKFRSVIALSVGLASAGCMQATAPRPPLAREDFRSPPGPSVRQLQRTPRMSTGVEFGRTLVTGSLATITLTLTNHEREAITLLFPTGCQLLYHVYDQHGNRVDEGWGCVFFPSWLTIEPGVTARQQMPFVAAQYDYSRQAYVPLPPGPYRIRAYLDRHYYESQSFEACWDYEGCFWSPPFVVRLLEQEPGGRL